MKNSRIKLSNGKPAVYVGFDRPPHKRAVSVIERFLLEFEERLAGRFVIILPPGAVAGNLSQSANLSNDVLAIRRSVLAVFIVCQTGHYSDAIAQLAAARALEVPTMGFVVSDGPISNGVDSILMTWGVRPREVFSPSEIVNVVMGFLSRKR